MYDQEVEGTECNGARIHGGGADAADVDCCRTVCSQRHHGHWQKFPNI